MHILYQTFPKTHLSTKKLNICVKGTKNEIKIDNLDEINKNTGFLGRNPLIFS